MQRMMRKYRHYILGFILLFIGLPMLFFGVPVFFEPQANQNDNVIGDVGGEEIYESAFVRNLDVAARRFGAQNEPLSFQQLAAQGHADRVIEEMLDSALINIQQKERSFKASNETAAEIMKLWPTFQDENGNFDEKIYTQWRDAQANRNFNWNELYKELHSQLDRQVFMNQALAASARFTEADIEHEVWKRTGKVSVRIAKADPPIDLTDEEIQAYYDENIDRYRNPDQRIARFVAFPLSSARPTKADEIFQKLQEGEDFAALADTYGDHQIKNGGDLGWQAPLDEEEAHRLPLFALGVGEVSELVEAPQGYFIYKVEEERTSEDTGQREVKARQIFLLKPDRSEDERVAQSERMNEIVTFANENGLEAAAEEYGGEIRLSGAFDSTSTEIDQISANDAVAFRSRLQNANAEGDFVAIIARDNNYCANVDEVVPGEPKPFDDVQDQVAMDLQRERSFDEEYRNAKKAYAHRIAREARTLEDISGIYPQAQVEIKNLLPFGHEDNLFMQGIQLLAGEIMDNLKGKQPGDIVGPIRNFVGDYYFVEFTEYIPNEETEPESIEEERNNALNMLLAQSTSTYLQDYRLYLRENMLPTIRYTLDQEAIGRILGLNSLDPTAPSGTDSAPVLTIPME